MEGIVSKKYHFVHQYQLTEVPLQKRTVRITSLGAVSLDLNVTE